MRVLGLGPTELIIILVIVIVLFGPGRLGKVLGELGSGLRSFRDGLGVDRRDDAQKTDKSGSLMVKMATLCAEQTKNTPVECVLEWI